MDFKQLATNISLFLAPFLPYLISGGEEAIKVVGKKLGESSWEKAKILWRKINIFVKDDPKLKGVSIALAEEPQDQDFQVAFAKLLVTQLENLPELADELFDLMKDDQSVQKVLIDQHSKVKNIFQRLSQSGSQEIVIRSSQAEDINQEQ